MAGGKETPRQKMIGMMYLVLTALLALNVSKSILDAFVSIEENIQKANIVQVDRGDTFIGDVKEELQATKGADQEAKRQKLKYVIQQMENIDKETAKIIGFIDGLKTDILKEAGEEISSFKPDDQKNIMWAKGDGVRPARMWLAAVQGMDKYDEPMHVMGIAESINNPTGKGAELWKKYNDYRAFIVSAAGTYKMPGSSKSFTITTKPINDFVDNKDLTKKVTAMVKSSKANLKEDQQVLIDLYQMLSKPEKNKVHDQEGVHWIGMTFDHSPLVAGIAALSSLQQEILSARAMALASYKSKVSTGEYSFNKIVALAYGPTFANTGDEVELKVMMAAFDSDNQPTVTGPGSITVADGQGTLKTRASGGNEMNLSGTVSIKNKSGVAKVEPWKHTVKIMKPSGAISLPELNVLYRGYQNKVSAVASGFDQTNLSASGASISKSGEFWIASPGAGREATLTVSGTNSVTKKSQQLLTQKFRVMNLPNPELYWGGSANGTQGSRSATQLFAKYGEGVPLNAQFTVVAWECQIPGAPGAPPRGSGSSIAAASNLIGQAKPGMNVSFIATVVGPDKIQRKIAGAYKL